MREKELEAIDFLRREIGTDRTMVGFSGGKDSIVTAHLVRKSGVQHDLVWTDTGIEPPAVRRFIRLNYPGVVVVKPRESFWKQIPKRNPPLRTARWCCTTLKKQPSWGLPYKKRIMGIRKEESRRRGGYPRVNHYTGYGQDQWHYYPILEWQEWQVWEYIEREGLTVPDLYDRFSRLGCVVCPMRGRRELEIWRELYPGYFRAFEKAVEEWYSRRVGQGRSMAYRSVEEFITAWYRGEASWYGGKERRGSSRDRNLDLFIPV